MKDYLKKNIDFLSDDEINYIFSELNEMEDTPKLDVGKEKDYLDIETNTEDDSINDAFLREIIRTSEKIDDSIDPFLREKFINELRQLAEEYVNMIINASENKAPLGPSKYAIQQSCIKELVEIESRITNSRNSMSASNDLVNDLKKLNLQIDSRKRK